VTFAQSVVEALRWYIVVTLLAAAVFPVVFFATEGLTDRGWSLARPLGLLFAVILSWWPAAVGLIPFINPVIAIATIAGGAVGWSFIFRQAEFNAFLRREWRAILAIEATWLVFFLGYVVFRGYNPAVAYTEKPMDLAFLSSSIRARAVPPPDPWFAGQPINYYYLGYLMMAVVARLSGTAAGAAFNLSLATLFASASVAAAGTAANLARMLGARARWRTAASALLGPLFLVGVGNLKTPWEFLHSPQATLSATWWEGVGWSASRVIVDNGIPGSSGPHQTINEFPAFSFILGDLHPHVLAIPIFISAIGLSVGLLRHRDDDFRLRGDLLPLAAVGAVGGALYAVNSWDMPTALVLGAGALFLRRGLDLRQRAARLGIMLAAAIVTALPFAIRYVPSVGSNAGVSERIAVLPVVGTLVRTIGIVDWSHSSLGSLLLVHGLFLTVALLVIGTAWIRLPGCRRPSTVTVLAVAGGTILVADLLGLPALVLFGLPAAFLGPALARDVLPESLRIPGWLFALGCSLILVTEVLFLQDAFGDRMNTVFKVYFQVWSLFAIAAAVALPSVVQLLAERLGKPSAWISGGLVGVLVVGAALYPPLSTYRWDAGFQSWQGIDGLAYVRSTDSAEAAGIAWLSVHAPSDSVVLEAPGCSYGVADGLPQDPVSMATGIPTVIGWNFHEYQWRDGSNSQLQQIQTRQQDVNQVYRDPTSARAREVLDRYHVTYIFVGALEERGSVDGCNVGPPYPAASLARLPQLGWPVVFQQGDVTVYGRPA